MQKIPFERPATLGAIRYRDCSAIAPCFQPTEQSPPSDLNWTLFVCWAGAVRQDDWPAAERRLPEPYILMLIGFGCLILQTAWLPMLLSEAPPSLPIACVVIGAVAFSLPISLSVPHPSTVLPFVERVTELIVIIALMGADLKIDRKLTWRSWMLTWRLLAIAMPVTILILTLLGQVVLGLGAAAALLVAAALAPTDTARLGAGRSEFSVPTQPFLPLALSCL